MNIKNFKEEILRNNNNKLIAYIILNDSNQNDKNYLIDVNGQKIERNQNGDFIYLYNNKKIIIQNFDVQNPKLRIFGARQRYSSLCSELSLYSQIQNQKFDVKNKKENGNKQSFDDKLKEGLKVSNKNIILNKKIQNKKDILSQKNKSYMNTSNKNNEDTNRSNKFFNKHNSINDIIKQTRDILNKSRNNNLLIKIPNDIKKHKNNLSLKNIYFNNSKFINSSLKENGNIKTEVNNNFLSLKNIFDNRLKKNLNIKTKNKNQLSINNNKYIFSNSNINISKSNNYSDSIKQNNSNNIYKDSFSFFLNKKINKNKKDLLLQKYKGQKIRLSTVIKGVDANITQIENNIKNAFQKSIKNDKKLSKSNRYSDNHISLKIFNSYNSFNNTSFVEFQKKKGKQQRLNFNNEIKLNKKCKISKSFEKSLNKKHSKYSVLSKQADDMIKNYFRNISHINNEENLKNKEKKNKFGFNKTPMNKLGNFSSNNILNNTINNKNQGNNEKVKKFAKNNQIIKLKLEEKENSILRRLLQKTRNFKKNEYKNITEDFGDKFIPNNFGNNTEYFLNKSMK